MKKYVLAILMILLGIIFYSFYNKERVPTQSARPIKIGTILSQTGIASAFGENAKDGAELARDEINAKGGINGRTIVLVHEDDRTDPKTAVGAYKKLTTVDHVDAIIGSNFDFVVNPLFAEAGKGTTAVVTPTSPKIPGALDTNAQSFTMLSDFNDIIAELDSYLTQSHYKTIAVIHYDGAFGKQITTTISNISVKNGKGEAIEETYNQFGITDWTPYILKMKKSGVDIVFADMLGADYARFAEQSKRLGFNSQLMTHMDVREALKDQSADMKSLDGTVVLNWDALGDDKEFNTKFKAKYGREADHFAAQSYVAVYVEAQAVAESASNNSTVAHILESKTFTTPLGQTSFTQGHSVATTKVKIQTIKSGKLVDL